MSGRSSAEIGRDEWRAGEEVGDLGANEVAEGLTRLAVADELAEESELLTEEGIMDVATGLDELELSDDLDNVAQDIATEGLAEVAVGSAELGAADVLHTVADVTEEVVEEEEEMGSEDYQLYFQKGRQYYGGLFSCLLQRSSRSPAQMYGND